MIYFPWHAWEYFCCTSYLYVFQSSSIQLLSFSLFLPLNSPKALTSVFGPGIYTPLLFQFLDQCWSSMMIFSSVLKFDFFFCFVHFQSHLLAFVMQFIKLCFHVLQCWVIRATSSANRRSLNFSPSSLIHLSSKGRFLKIASIAAVNTFGDKIFPCLTPLDIFIWFQKHHCPNGYEMLHLRKHLPVCKIPFIHTYFSQCLEEIWMFYGIECFLIINESNTL